MLAGDSRDPSLPGSYCSVAGSQRGGRECRFRRGVLPRPHSLFAQQREALASVDLAHLPRLLRNEEWRAGGQFISTLYGGSSLCPRHGRAARCQRRSATRLIVGPHLCTLGQGPPTALTYRIILLVLAAVRSSRLLRRVAGKKNSRGRARRERPRVRVFSRALGFLISRVGTAAEGVYVEVVTQAPLKER